MQSDYLKIHMKQHEKRNEGHPTRKRKLEDDDDKLIIRRKCNEIDDDELEKMLDEITVEYDHKIALGKRVYKIIERGKLRECALPKDMQNALNLYRNNMGVGVEMEEVIEKELASEDENEIVSEERGDKNGLAWQNLV